MKNILMTFALIAGLVLTVSMSSSYAGQDKSEGSFTKEDITPAASMLTGKVKETMDSGGYTYINIEKDGKTTWAAIPKTGVKVGQEVSVLSGYVMNNFTSKTLGRTFDAIVFSSGFSGGAENKSTESKGMPSDSTHGASVTDKKVENIKIENIKVEKASGPDAYTVAELYAKSGDLNTKNVVFHGQVVKVTQAVLGKNWIHLRDGSGSAAAGDNDMTVTSNDVPSVGDIVMVKGTLSKDKDFGSGYKYSVIVEEASIKK